MEGCKSRSSLFCSSSWVHIMRSACIEYSWPCWRTECLFLAPSSSQTRHRSTRLNALDRSDRYTKINLKSKQTDDSYGLSYESYRMSLRIITNRGVRTSLDCVSNYWDSQSENLSSLIILVPLHFNTCIHIFNNGKRWWKSISALELLSS